MASFSDNFERADNIDLGANWTPQVAGRDCQIVGGAVEPIGAGSRNEEQYTATTPGADQFAQITIKAIGSTTVDTACGVLNRAAATGTETFYVARAVLNASGNHTDLGKRVAGAFTSLAGETAITWAANDTLKLTSSGTNFVVYRNSASVVTLGSESSIAAGGTGVYSFASPQSESQIGDFSGGDLFDATTALAPMTNEALSSAMIGRACRGVYG